MFHVPIVCRLPQPPTQSSHLQLPEEVWWMIQGTFVVVKNINNKGKNIFVLCVAIKIIEHQHQQKNIFHYFSFLSDAVHMSQGWWKIGKNSLAPARTHRPQHLKEAYCESSVSVKSWITHERSALRKLRKNKILRKHFQSLFYLLRFASNCIFSIPRKGRANFISELLNVLFVA